MDGGRDSAAIAPPLANATIAANNVTICRRISRCACNNIIYIVRTRPRNGEKKICIVIKITR